MSAAAEDCAVSEEADSSAEEAVVELLPEDGVTVCALSVLFAAELVSPETDDAAAVPAEAFNMLLLRALPPYTMPVMAATAIAEATAGVGFAEAFLFGQTSVHLKQSIHSPEFTVSTLYSGIFIEHFAVHSVHLPHLLRVLRMRKSLALETRAKTPPRGQK